MIASGDGFIRRVVIKYFNSEGESPKDVSQPEFTDRSVRTIVKLWSIDEVCLNDDLVELHEKYDTRGNHVEGVTDDHDGELGSQNYHAGVKLEGNLVGVYSVQGYCSGRFGVKFMMAVELYFTKWGVY